MKPPIRRVFAAIIIICLMPAVSDSAAGERSPERGWLDGFTLVELDTDDVGSLHEARALIQSYGGHIAIISPPSLLLGWVPMELRGELIGKANIKDVYFTDVIPGEVELKDEQTRHVVTFFNRVIRGEYQDGIRGELQAAPPLKTMSFEPDALARGPFEEQEYLANLEANGFNLQNLKDRGLLLEKSPEGALGNSDKMTGTVTTTLIFVESDGSSSDPNLYTWTDQHVQDYIAGVNTGLAWWSSRARNYGSCWVAFLVRYFSPTDSRCQHWREMILHDQPTVASMVSDVMSNFGYSSGTHLAKTTSFNTAQRATYGTDWAYTGFVAYNPPPASDRLTDGKSAWAYLLGPYTFLLYRSFSWQPDEVFTHESGHIFGACDEYASGCSCPQTCTNGVLNDNCEDCSSSVPCMMKYNSFSLCAYTDGHVGWRSVPCAPAPLTPPTANSITPGRGLQGLDVAVTIEGSNFLYGAFAEVGPGVTTTSSEVLSPGTLKLTLTIDNDAAPGIRDVVVKNRDLQSSTIVQGFEVLASTRHYVSTAGTAVFPYVTAASAAAALGEALNASADGDTILVESTTFNINSLVINRGALLSGGWVDDFTSRDLAGGKTVLDVSNNITILPTTGGLAGLDGFVVQNGSGTANMTPRSGNYGGGVKITNATAKIANCEIRQNQATPNGGFGGGGGIFAEGSTVTIQDNHIHDNTATYGGGIYLYDCGGTVSGNTVAGNAVSTMSIPPEGGGIAMEACTGLVIAGNTFVGNTGASNGGGAWIKNSAGVSFDGDVLKYNASSFSGAGAAVFRSEVDFDGVGFLRNTSSALGGAIAATDTSVLTLNECKLLWNSAIIGAGLYQTDGDATVRHGLFVGNTAASNSGAIYLSGITAGEVAGNTIDRNAGPSGAGGIFVINAPVEVYNNLVTNSTGHGISCSGTLPTLTYNDVWNSSGADYNGCSAGAGSISLEPLFSDTSVTDYHLAVHSPAIDTGRPGGAFDDPDESPGDMGMYGSNTFVMDQPSYPKNLSAGLVLGDVVLNWDKNPEGDVVQYAVYGDSARGFAPAAANFIAFVAAPDTSVNLGAVTDTSYYKISAVDTDGYASGYSNEASISPPTGVGDEVAGYQNRLYQNVPNPFNPTTTIRYELRKSSVVGLAIYDVSGSVVKRLLQSTRRAGLHAVMWDGTNEAGQRVSSGVYFYKLTTDRFTQTKKMALLK